jgi:RNA polymerase sigma-70 factor (ECF subfamily)
MASTPISLLEQLRHQPDDAAWRRLVELYTPLLQGWLRRFGVQRCDADDLIQEALAAVFQALPDFRHNQKPGAFRRWLRVILLHRLLPFFRARKQRPEEVGSDKVLQQLHELEDPNSASSRQWDLEHDRHVVGRLLETIRPEFQPTTWQAFLRLGLEGARGEDVARELGISVNAAIIAKCRVLNRLRQLAQGLVD